MNKKTFTSILLFLLLFTLIFLSSCTYASPNGGQGKESFQESGESTEKRIKELEAQIITLLQSQKLSEEERKKEIAILKSEITALKSGKDEAPAEDESDKESETSLPEVFKYTLDGYKATITSICTEEESIVVPAVLDGHAVVAIGSNALKAPNLKRIVLSEGIESLDWFALKGCPSLSLVSFPKSVTSIGYGAFDGASKSLVIECHTDSFAMKYAQSYGLKYDAK